MKIDPIIPRSKEIDEKLKELIQYHYDEQNLLSRRMFIELQRTVINKGWLWGSQLERLDAAYQRMKEAVNGRP